MASVTSQKYNTPVLKKNQPDDSYKFLPLPNPSGPYPYRLMLKDVNPNVDSKKLVFHMVGDTGSVRNLDFQKLVAGQMIRQYEEAEAAEDKPQFLYHLGDLVYNFGEAEQYKAQFFDPYQNYPASIFAIAGNHDSDVNPDNPNPYNSLDAFMTVFCDTERRNVSFSGNAKRQSQIQPNVYWTLNTHLARIIGLHSNVPKYGVIKEEQRKWFIDELKAAEKERPGKAIIVCLHHSPYSADINHSSSLPMIEFLEGAFEETGIRPDVVFSGHVHNYQRFEKQYRDGLTVPFIVAGGGGYDELHSIAMTNNDNFTNNNPFLKNVLLKSYVDNQHGFLKVALEKSGDGVILSGKYYSIPHPGDGADNMSATLADSFSLSTLA